jgi:hypothetical protein
VNPGKKAGRPVVLELQPNFDILSQMKSLHIQFLDDQGMSFLRCHWETRAHQPQIGKHFVRF